MIRCRCAAVVLSLAVLAAATGGGTIRTRGPDGTADRPTATASARQALSVAARHAPKSELEQAAYSFQIPRHPEIYLNLDLKQMGVGGVDSWSRLAFPMEACRIPANQPYSYRYRLKPIGGTVR